jgi:hypothetical protein
MHEGKSPLGKLRAFPLSLASGKSPLVRLSLSLFGFGLSELGFYQFDDNRILGDTLSAYMVLS